MAITNYEPVGEGLELLREGLAPFVARELKARDYVDNGGAASNQKPVAERDVASLLKLIWDNWQLVFRNTLGNAERSLVSELRGWRNKWAHQENISSDDAYRALDSASRLLAAVSAPQSEELDWLKRGLLRVPCRRTGPGRGPAGRKTHRQEQHRGFEGGATRPTNRWTRVRLHRDHGASRPHLNHRQLP